MPPKQRIALGLKVRTGRAIVVALRDGAPPEIVLKTQIAVATTFAAGAVYHAAQELTLERARALVERSERRCFERARAALADCTASLQGKLVGSAMVAAEPKSPTAARDDPQGSSDGPCRRNRALWPSIRAVRDRARAFR